MSMAHMASAILDRELKKGSAELLILSLVEDRPRHGYDIGQLIETALATGRCISTSLRFIRCFTGWRSGDGFAGAGWRRPGNGGGVITG